MSQPFLDAMLPNGHRLHVVRDGISWGFKAVKTAGNTVNETAPPFSHSNDGPTVFAVVPENAPQC